MTFLKCAQSYLVRVVLLGVDTVEHVDYFGSGNSRDLPEILPYDRNLWPSFAYHMSMLFASNTSPATLQFEQKLHQDFG